MKQFDGDKRLIKSLLLNSIDVFAKDFSLPNLLDLLTMAQTPFLGCGQLCRDLHGFRCHLQILNAVFNQRPCVFVLHWDLQIL